MKMKYFAFAAIGLAALSLPSCSNEADIISGVDVVKTQQLTFNISIPKADPVTYSAIHDADEYGIESLWMYEFDADGAKLLADPINIKNNLTGAGPDYTYTKTVTATNKGTRQFVFVANEQVAGIVKGSSLAQLTEKMASNKLVANASSSTLLNTFTAKKRIPMTGEAKQGASNLISVTGTNSTNIKVEMTRIVARLDITNSVPDLKITDVKLANTNSLSYVFLKGDSEKPTTNSKVSGITPFTAISGTGLAHNQTLNKAFYLYEGAQPSNKEEAVHVQVTGTRGGTPVFYNIPFYKGTNPVTVKRNHIYKLVLKEAGATTVTPIMGASLAFSIQDTPWNEITLNERFSAFKYLFSAPKATSPFTFDNETRTLTFNNIAYPASEKVTIRMGHLLISHGPVVEITPEGGDWIKVHNHKEADKKNAKYLVLEANTTGKERRAKLRISFPSQLGEEEVSYVNVIQKP